MTRYAFVQFYYGQTVNMVLQVVDAEEKPTELPNGVNGYWVDATDYPGVQVGWKGTTSGYPYTDWVLSELTYQEYVDLATKQIQDLLTVAVNWLKVNPLQYKLDLGVASPEEQTLLQAYKQYYVDVADVNKQSGYPSAINWPAAPF